MNRSRIQLAALAALLAGAVQAGEIWHPTNAPGSIGPVSMVEQDGQQANSPAKQSSTRVLTSDPHRSGDQYLPAVQKATAPARQEQSTVIFRIFQKTIGDAPR